MAPQFIVTRHPAVRDLLSPQVEHLQTLVLSRAILHLLWHVAFFAPLWVACPVSRERQAEVEQGMIPARHVPHVHADLTVVDLASVASPLPFHPHRMSPPLREAAGIKGDHPIGFPQLLDDLSD